MTEKQSSAVHPTTAAERIIVAAAALAKQGTDRPSPLVSLTDEELRSGRQSSCPEGIGAVSGRSGGGELPAWRWAGAQAARQPHRLTT